MPYPVIQNKFLYQENDVSSDKVTKYNVVLQNNFHFQQNLHKRNASRTVSRIWELIFQQGCALRNILGIQMI